MTGAKLDGVCGLLEKNEQAEDEASQTLEFLLQKEWLDADIDDSEKLTAHHCVQDMEGVADSKFIAKRWKKSKQDAQACFAK